MMIKKIAQATALLLATTTAAHAGVFYMGPSLQYQSVTSNSQSFQSVSPRLTAGYGEKLEFPYYLAGEIFAVAGNINGHPDNNNLKNTPSFGLSVLPGFMLYDNSFLYGRLGAVATSFAVNDAYTWGGQIGIGIETAITDTWDIRTEYTFTQYGDLDSTAISSPHANSLTLGVIHRFK